MNPLITVITLAFNSSYLLDSIRSVLDQTYPSIQYLIVDDGSFDFNKAAVCSYIEQHMLSNYGSEKKYNHELSGNNSRLDELQAAFLQRKLPYLETWNKERNRIAERYLTEIHNPELILPTRVAPYDYQVWHIFAIRCKHRDTLQKYLAQNDIGTNIHYPIPIHLQKCYASLELTKGSLPIAEEISETVLSLPMYYGMTDDEISYVIDKLNNFH